MFNQFLNLYPNLSSPLQLRHYNLILPKEKPSFLNPYRENNDVIVFLFPFHIFMPLANLWLIRLQGQQGQVFILRIRTSTHSPTLGIHSVPSYVSRLWCCPFYTTRKCSLKIKVIFILTLSQFIQYFSSSWHVHKGSLPGPGYWWQVIFSLCEIDDAIQYINLGYGAQSPKIVIL